MKQSISRRSFVAGLVSAVALLTLIPAKALGLDSAVFNVLIEVAAANNLGRAAFLAVVEVAYADGRIVRFPTGKRGWKASIDGGKTFVEPTEICPYGEGVYGTFEQFRGNRNSR